MKYFVRLSVGLILMMLIALQSWGDPVLKGKVSYISDKPVIDIGVPEVTGKYYNDIIPDTLDIADRADLAINILTENPDPDADYEIFWVTCFLRNPPFMWHDWSDWNAEGWKFYEALSLLRLVSGNEHKTFIDDIFLEVALRSIGPDGLFYVPMIGRPWAKLNDAWGPLVWREDGSTVDFYDDSVVYYSNPLPTGRVLGMFVNYYQRDHDPRWKILIEKMIDRSLELMIDKGDWGYMPLSHYEPNAKISSDAPVPTALIGIESYARMIQAPALYYGLTGYEPAKELALKQINTALYHGNNFDSEGRFIGTDEGMEQDRNGAHFHAHTFILMSVVDYAAIVGDTELLDFVVKSYEWAKTMGNPTVGFFPEWISPNYPFSEMCEVADMVATAIKLSQAGAGDFWDDAEKWIRNQFAEGQLTKIDCIYKAIEKMEKTPPREGEVLWQGPYDSVPEGAICYDYPLERNIGGFAGWPSANDWINEGEESYRGIMGCCVGNAARTLYYIWENILDYKDGVLKVNMLLNRADKVADFYSFLPYDGQVQVKVKEPCKSILIHMPKWIEDNSTDVTCEVNGEPVKIKWDGRYVDLGKGKQGDIFKVKFPIHERTVKEKIAGKEYKLVIRGNTVVSINPPGKYCPFYQREYYSKNQMPWRPVTRFVADNLADY